MHKHYDLASVGKNLLLETIYEKFIESPLSPLSTFIAFLYIPLSPFSPLSDS